MQCCGWISSENNNWIEIFLAENVLRIIRYDDDHSYKLKPYNVYIKILCVSVIHVVAFNWFSIKHYTFQPILRHKIK